MKYKDFPEWYKEKVPEYAIPNFSQVGLFKLVSTFRNAALTGQKEEIAKLVYLVAGGPGVMQVVRDTLASVATSIQLYKYEED